MNFRISWRIHDVIKRSFHYLLRGRSQTMLTWFWPLLTTYLVDTHGWHLRRNSFTVLRENLHTVNISSTIYLLVNVVCERPPFGRWICRAVESGGAGGDTCPLQFLVDQLTLSPGEAYYPLPVLCAPRPPGFSEIATALSCCLIEFLRAKLVKGTFLYDVRYFWDIVDRLICLNTFIILCLTVFKDLTSHFYKQLPSPTHLSKFQSIWRKELKSLAENIPNAPKFIRPICPIGPKVWVSIIENRLHWASAVCDSSDIQEIT